jgi:hypothetical protein
MIVVVAMAGNIDNVLAFVVTARLADHVRHFNILTIGAYGHPRGL